MRETFDAIVCGGGTAGPAVVARLVAAGHRVLLLEAGPDYGPFEGEAWPAELVDAATIPTSHDWGYVSGEELPNRSLAYERARVIGGCSAHNGCTVGWGHRADYDGWRLPGWSAEELLPLFRDVSRRMRVRRFLPEEIAPFHRAFIDAGVELGLPERDLLETLDPAPSVCVEPSNSPEGIRWNAAFAYLDAVRGEASLDVRGDTLVDRVLMSHGRAVGIRAIGPGGPFEAGADVVVLSAGTYGSPAILLRSGIGPAEDLRSLGITPVMDMPGVGTNLHDHPAFEVFLRPSREHDLRSSSFAASGRPTPDEQSFCSAASSFGAGLVDLHVFAEVSMDRRLGIFVACVAPRSRGRLTLRNADPEAVPRLDHAYLSDPEGRDLAVLVEGAELAHRFASSPSMAPLLDGDPDPAPGADLPGAIRRGVIHYWHPVGTCAMGSVTDERGRVLDVEGLVVADASLMPRTPRATTNIPTLVVAERVAGFLV